MLCKDRGESYSWKYSKEFCNKVCDQARGNEAYRTACFTFLGWDSNEIDFNLG